MKNMRICVTVFAALLFSQSAMALSVEQRDNTNSDGTARFADPDQQMPAGLVSPDSMNNGGRVGPLSGAAVVAPGVPQMLGVDRGGEAFDQAYGHVTNQNR